MARENKSKEPPKGNSKGKITVVMFQLEGDDVTLQDAIKVFGQGMEKLASPAPIIYQRMLPVSGSMKAKTLPLINDESEEEPLESEHSEPEEEAEEVEAGPPDSAKPKKHRIMKALAPLKGVDWDSEMPFREYCQQKRPTNNQEKYLVVGGWFKNHRQDEFLTPAHIVAAFDFMDWAKPEDIGQIFRHIKHAKEWFDKGSKQNQWILGQRGINQLDRMGRGAAVAEG